MNKRVILITGTPCTGKTTVAKQLTTRLDALYINLTELAKTHSLTIGEDKTRNTTIVDEEEMRKKTAKTIDGTEKTTVIVDGHYAAAVVPKRYVTYVFVLRRNPIELRKFMEKRGFSDAKLRENLASEILDVCLIEALQEQETERVCELDITGKIVDAVVNQIIAVLNQKKPCSVGNVDWLGMLEKEGLLDDYLTIT
ncbi:adenylate kinase family protein [Candidatus Bathyarchaeota archaeon]|nr:adenylate kinase family protein [Candidatus Bathyarchaeota archaeon]